MRAFFLCNPSHWKITIQSPSSRVFAFIHSQTTYYYCFFLLIILLHVLEIPESVLLRGIMQLPARQVTILIVIYIPKLGQAKTAYLICIPMAAKKLLVRDCKRSSRDSRRNSIASVHSKAEHISGMSGKFMVHLIYLIPFFFNEWQLSFALKMCLTIQLTLLYIISCRSCLSPVLFCRLCRIKGKVYEES